MSAKPAISSASCPAAPGGVVAVASGKKMAMIVEIVVIVILGGLSIFLYMQNAGLNAKISSLGASAGASAASGASTQVADLQNQVQALTTSQATLQSQMGGLTAANGDLQTELSFFATPSGTSAAAISSGTITGALAITGGAKKIYSVRTQYGAVIFVKNSSDAKTAAILEPLVGSSVALAGTYVSGSDSLAVVSVNGSPVNPPMVATSTAATAPMTPVATSTTSTAPATTTP